MSATAPKSLLRRAWIAARFVLFGFVGFWIMLIFSIEFIVGVFDHAQQVMNPVLSLPFALVGALMMLHGVGEWGRWGYLLVFLSIPISLGLLMLLPGAGNSKELPVLVAAIAAVGTYVGVRGYYERRVRRESQD